MSEQTDAFLEHFGVKGMKWGRKKAEGTSPGLGSAPPGIPQKRMTRKEAKAYTKKDPNYKKAFDHHMANQDLGKHADKARKERRRKDVAGGTAKTARGVHRSLTGGMGNVTMLSAGIAAGAVAARKSGADQVIFNAAKTQLKNAQAKKNSGKAVNDWLKNNGFQ